MMSTWTQTYSGERFELLAPTPEMVHPIDLAVSLSRLARYNGHTKDPYSVAQHVLLCADMVREAGGSREQVLAAILHDGHEAYLSDVPSPLKWALGDAWSSFAEIETGVDAAVAGRFDLDPSLFKHDLVKLADISALWHEYHALFREQEHEWAWDKMFAGRTPLPLPQYWANLQAWGTRVSQERLLEVLEREDPR